MIHQLKKNNVPSKVEETLPAETIASPNKFQRTSRRGIRSPE